MKESVVKHIADAVLYEGYLLYPYRPSAVKNQQRWNFGSLCPESYSQAQAGAESWTMQTQVLLESESNTSLDVLVRFLHLSMREVTQEAVEREVELRVANLELPGPTSSKFSFPATETTERRQQAIEGIIEVQVEHCEVQRLRKVTVHIRNLTPFEDAGRRTRDESLMRSFVSTHTILTVQDGQFVSMLDPPEQFREAAATCTNVGTYPVLVGEEGARDCMLSSPIILYDYPQIAPESAGALFDGTEIDEILTLRIMTLTDAEKEEMRTGDDRARQILERTETLPLEQLMKMHGAMKAMKATNEHE